MIETEVRGNTEKQHIQAELTISKKEKKSQAVLLTCFFSLDTITALWHHLTD